MASEYQQIRLRQQMSRRIVAGKISTARQILLSGQAIEFVLPVRAAETNLVEQRMRLFGRITLALRDVAVVETEPEPGAERLMSCVMRPATV